MKPALSKLKFKRLLLCKTQKEVAAAISISQTYLAQMENNKEPIRGEILVRLSRYYGCKSTDLI